MWHLLAESLSITGPAFGPVMLGILGRRLGFVGDQLIASGSRVVFNIGMPLVLFFAAMRADYARMLDSGSLLTGLAAITLTVVLAYGFSSLRGIPVAHRGVFVQGAYRSNMGIVGIALCLAAYGDQGLMLAAVPLAVWTLYYNLLAVVLLNWTLHGNPSFSGMFFDMLKNPLIIGICAGAILSITDARLPPETWVVGEWSARLFIPFALLCIGGALNLAALKNSARETVEASAWRLVVSPLLAVGLAILVGLRGPELGVFYLLLAGPTAAASFVMVVAAGGNGALAANIVVLTTLVSTFTVTLGLFVLRLVGLV